MGNACTSCTVKEDESKTEMKESQMLSDGVIVDTPGFGGKDNTPLNRQSIQSQHLGELPQRYQGGQYMIDASNSNNKHRVFSNDKMQQFMLANIKSVIRIQAFVRRILSRKAIKEYVEMRDTYRMHARYFTRDELFETLSNKYGPPNPKQSTNIKSILKSKQHQYANGGVYTGEWMGGFRQGKGRMEWSDSASYEGMWELGYASGQGVFTDCLGNRYQGSFKMSMAHGQGTYTNTMGAIYEGEWRFDMQHGKGIEKWTNSDSIFEGNFVDGLRNGHGVWVHKNKRYEGNWKNNMMEGEGTMEWDY